MKSINVFAGGLGFAEGLGAGAVLALLVAASAFVWKPDVFGGRLAPGGTGHSRVRRNLENAERLAKLSPDYLDICRAAGL
jgi:hypothetical protein